MQRNKPHPMNEDDRVQRRARIEAAAFELLNELGYRKTSMLLIAKRAQASNQTMYAWYRNKQDLFRGIIEEHGRAVREQLAQALHDSKDPLRALANLGPTLLRFTTSPQAVIMNRAAVTDAADTGVLARAIDEVARSSILPLIGALMQRLCAAGVFAQGTSANEAAEAYVALLFGELQLRQAMGTQLPCDEAEIGRRAGRALDLTLRLFAPGRRPA